MHSVLEHGEFSVNAWSLSVGEPFLFSTCKAYHMLPGASLMLLGNLWTWATNFIFTHRAKTSLKLIGRVH